MLLHNLKTGDELAYIEIVTAGLKRSSLSSSRQMQKVECLFDFASPNCYVALAKLRKMKIFAKNWDVTYSPLFLGGLFKLTGNAPIPVDTLEFNYMEKNLRRLSEYLGIDYHFSRKRFPVNSLKALRGYYFAESDGKAQEYLDKIFRACWADDRDISDLVLLQNIVGSVNSDPDHFAEFIEKDETKLKLKGDTQRAFDRGVFGAPTFFIDGEMYWGSPEVLWYLECTSLP